MERCDLKERQAVYGKYGLELLATCDECFGQLCRLGLCGLCG